MQKHGSTRLAHFCEENPLTAERIGAVGTLQELTRLKGWVRALLDKKESLERFERVTRDLLDEERHS